MLFRFVLIAKTVLAIVFEIRIFRYRMRFVTLFSVHFLVFNFVFSRVVNRFFVFGPFPQANPDRTTDLFPYQLAGSVLRVFVYTSAPYGRTLPQCNRVGTCCTRFVHLQAAAAEVGALTHVKGGQVSKWVVSQWEPIERRTCERF